MVITVFWWFMHACVCVSVCAFMLVWTSMRPAFPSACLLVFVLGIGCVCCRKRLLLPMFPRLRCLFRVSWWALRAWSTPCRLGRRISVYCFFFSRFVVLLLVDPWMRGWFKVVSRFLLLGSCLLGFVFSCLLLVMVKCLFCGSLPRMASPRIHLFCLLLLWLFRLSVFRVVVCLCCIVSWLFSPPLLWFCLLRKLILLFVLLLLWRILVFRLLLSRTRSSVLLLFFLVVLMLLFFSCCWLVMAKCDAGFLPCVCCHLIHSSPNC